MSGIEEKGIQNIPSCGCSNSDDSWIVKDKYDKTIMVINKSGFNKISFGKWNLFISGPDRVFAETAYIQCSGCLTKMNDKMMVKVLRLFQREVKDVGN